MTAESPPADVETVSTILLGSATHLLVSGVRAIAFWTAIVLPLAQVAVLHNVADAQSGLSLSLLALNVICLFAGHRHAPGL